MKRLAEKAWALAAVVVLAVLIAVPTADAAGPGSGGGGSGGVGGAGGGAGGNTITAVRVGGPVLLAPSDPVWSNATAVNIGLVFNDSVNGNAGGGSASVSVKAIHNGTDIAFLLSWSDTTSNSVVDGVQHFTDAAAIMLSANNIITMGTQSNPTNIWYWRAVDNSVQNIVSGGLGTITHTEGDDNIEALSNWDGSQWQVVLSRPLAAIDADDQAGLEPGGNYPVAFATWDGANQERDGRKMRSSNNTLNVAP